MPGAPDPEYVLARKVLLDALEALGDQRAAVVLVGAQAIYLHTGDADLAVAPYTTDGDVALDPSRLKDAPKLAEALRGAGFSADLQQVGSWIMSLLLEGKSVDVKIDFMVPEAVGGPGRRGARLGPHGNKTARKARGLEATLVDQQRRTIEALDDEDGRAFEIAVAGPAALLVAKLHKIAERVDSPGRSEDKDALDVLRLLRAVSTEAMADGVRTLLNAEISTGVTEEALSFLRDLFSEPSRPGCWMAARAAAPLEPEDTITASCAVLSQDLLQAVMP
ncbi:MAG: GSU2403 family nucleotidyltransferase fold protein [Rubrobacteraceae bacterium]